MKKRLFSVLFLSLVLSVYIVLLTSCGMNEGFVGISASVKSFSQLANINEDGTILEIEIEVYNRNDKISVDGCEINFKFYDNTDTLLQVRREKLDIFIDPDGTFSGSVTLMDTTNVFSNTAYIEAVPYSMNFIEDNTENNGYIISTVFVLIVVGAFAIGFFNA